MQFQELIFPLLLEALLLILATATSRSDVNTICTQSEDTQNNGVKDIALV